MRYIRAAGAALFVPTILFVTAVNGVVLRNLEEIPYNSGLTWQFLAVGLAVAILSAPAFLMSDASSRWAIVARSIVLVGVSVMVLDAASTLLVEQQVGVVIAIEVVLVLALGVLLFRIPLEVLATASAVLGPLLLVTGGYEHYATVREHLAGAGSTAARQIRSAPTLHPVGLAADLRPEFRWPQISDAKNYKIAVYDEVDNLYVVEAVVEGNSFVPDQPLDPRHSYRWKFAEVRDGGVYGRYRQWVRFNYSGLADLRRGRLRESADAEPRFPGNVYQIVFDAYQGAAYEHLVDGRAESELPPFTYYPNFHANSGKTWSSVAQMLWGRHYAPTMPIVEWRVRAYQEGLPQRLFTENVRLHQYPHYNYFCYEFATTCRTNLNLKADYFGRPPGSKTVVDLWFLNLLPTSARMLLVSERGTVTADQLGIDQWDYGFSITDALFGVSLEPTDRDNSFFSILQFEEFLEDEVDRASSGEYVYVHSILPHGPYVVNADCEYVGERKEMSERSKYLQHIRCVDRLIGRMLDRLRSLDRFENSLVIIQSDHGWGWHPEDLGPELLPYNPMSTDVPSVRVDEADSGTWPSEIIEVRSSALLLIKQPEQRLSEVSSKHVQMLDVAPTVADYFGIMSPGNPGVPVDELSPHDDRPISFYAFNKIPQDGAPRFLSRYEFQGGTWVFRETIETVR